MADPLTNQDCIQGLQAVMNTFSGKWSFLIMGALLSGPKQFKLTRLLQISTRSLTLALRSLTDADVITRTVIPTSPVQVKYALTPKGQDFQKILTAMLGWQKAWSTK